MSSASDVKHRSQPVMFGFLTLGMFWLVLATLAAAVFFKEGFDALLTAWQLPEYSHGPLIPILSALLFLRQLKEYPPNPGPLQDRWIGVTVILAAVLLGALGKLANISEVGAYALILWVGGMLLVSFGWKTGKYFWPPVLHLVYMLPLPDTLYYKMSTVLQLISSELGVWFLHLLSVPVFLEGNIIDLGVLKLHVAEACSGLRYLFPILSFSYIFAVLYRGPMWHKAVLLISAAPITVLMNSVRIAVAGVLAQYYGVEWLEGFTHFFEGWVIFMSCIVILFGLAWVMMRLQKTRMRLADALDLNTDGFGTQALRLRLVQPSAAMITSALLLVGASLAWQAMPDRSATNLVREPFLAFPRALGAWEQQGPHQRLSQEVAVTLNADDYHNVTLGRADAPSVGLFMAFYNAQGNNNGIHSPEVCLPAAGWEIAWLERIDIAEQLHSPDPFPINKAIIQKGTNRMMVYYWYEQQGRQVASDLAAKFWLFADGVRTGRSDGGIVRLTTIIADGETDEDAAARLMDVLMSVEESLPRFMPE